MGYKPPYTITSKMLPLSTEIGIELTKIEVNEKDIITPKLRKKNRIKTLAGTLEIEGNFLGEEKITAILDGKRVLGTYEEVLEVEGAINAYKEFEKYRFDNLDDLLKAHKILMQDIIKEAGVYRKKNVGVGNKYEITHIAPPAQNVDKLMNELFQWLNSDFHPLILSSVFHYELEFIHPFVDGNGRIGRFWHTLILYNWREVFEYLPIESLIYENQEDYYKAIENSTAKGNSTLFIEFMLNIILQSFNSPQATPQVTPQDKREREIIKFCQIPRSRKEISEFLGIKDRKYLKQILDKMMEKKLIQMTLPNKPTSPNQKYIAM